MEKIQGQQHTITTFYYALSRMLERASYYGFRSIIVLYMIGETLKMESNEALKVYGWFTLALVITHIIGAVFGDLLVGNKKGILIGGVTQAIGAFSLCIPSTIGLYLGICLVVLGSGFFTPNIISNFGKSYLNKTKLLDSGFTIFYLAINLGAFFGVLLIGYIADNFGYSTGFILSGILILLSLVPILISKEPTSVLTEKPELSINRRVLHIFIAVFVVGLFWSIYEIPGAWVFELQKRFRETSTLGLSKSIWQSISSIFTLPISLVAIIVWTYFYNSPFFKLILGFIFAILSFGLLLLIPDIPTTQHAILYLLSMFFLGVSEIYISPTLYSILTKYSNPKYLAMLISIAFIPTRLFSGVFGLFNEKFYENPALGIIFGIIIMIIISIALVVYVLWNKKSNHNYA